MTDFAGFDEWVEIFKGGKQKDSQGVEHDGDEVIRKAINTFDPNYYEPPLVVGHPVHNAPAFGWVAGLKKAGNVLYAKFKDVAAEFEDLVKQGLFKKRSASFYPDGRLRYVGFLGAMPPAVKGLADMSFGDRGEFTSFEFTDDPGEILHQKALELIDNPPKYDRYGREFGETISYRDALNFVMDANPELAEKYIQSIHLNR